MSNEDELYFTFDLEESNSINATYDLEENNSINANFNIYASGVTWGSIIGDIANQNDLNNIITNLQGQITANSNTVTAINDVISTYGDVVTYNASDFATAAQGVLATTALQPGDNIARLTNNVGYITASALNGYATQLWVTGRGYITGINGADVVMALGYTPYNATNPSGYITSADIPTLEDLTTTAQLNAINSGATTSNIGQITTNTNNINSLSSTVTSNYNTLQNADNNLQSQIDAITAASDVTDIVGTYAQLQNYDTSALPNNSIIKVLQDESINDETTYYRWVITSGIGSWVLIGEEGPYYTIAAADNKFVPQTRTINGQPLTNNITLTAYDVGALPSSTVIPTVNNSTITIQKNGINVQSFTLNQSTDATINITVPTDTNDLTNGAGYITSSALPIVDQTFDGSSTNAQSGVAVNDALTGGTVNPVFNKNIAFANQTNIESFTDDEEGITGLLLSSGSNTLRVLNTGIFYNNNEIATQTWVNSQEYVTSVNNVQPDSNGNVVLNISNEVFIAEYQVTPAQDIFDAIDAGKTVLCKKAFSNGYDYYSLGRYSPSHPGAVFYLERKYNVYSIDVYIENNADGWRASDVTVADNTLSNVSSANIISALGYTPYNATNPNGYITGITSSNVTNALGYTPVNKAGDTMSGRLTASGVTSTNNIEINFDTSVSKGTIPTTTKYRGFSINDGDSSHSAWQEKRFGLIECQLNTDGSSVITVSALKNQANSTSSASLVLGMSQSGSAYCTFPNTTCVDGQWVLSYSQIANAVSLPNTDAITYDLSGYLPADSNTYDYEVYVTGNVISGATSGNIAVLSIQGALIADVCGAITRTNSSAQTRGTVVMPILHNNRNLIIRAITNNTGTFSLQLRGYRRLGTNA